MTKRDWIDSPDNLQLIQIQTISISDRVTSITWAESVGSSVLVIDIMNVDSFE